MKWFKFYGGDYLGDPKILSLTAQERSCWITLLCYASLTEDGKIRHLTEEILITQAGVSFDPYDDTEMKNLKDILKKLEALSMITFDNSTISITNWKKRQESNLTGYERIKRFRAKNKEKMTYDNEMITLDKTRLDKNIISTLPPAKMVKIPPLTENPLKIAPDSAFQDIRYEDENVSRETKKEGRNKVAMRIQGKYNEWVKKEIGGDPRVDYSAKGYVLLVKKLNKYAEAEIMKVLDWYITSKKFQEHPQITAALSEDSLMRYFKNNGE